MKTIYVLYEHMRVPEHGGSHGVAGIITEAGFFVSEKEAIAEAEKRYCDVMELTEHRPFPCFAPNRLKQ